MIAEESKNLTLSFLDHLTNRFNEEGIAYWLDYGSLLGAVREKGIIPHDYDIDIGVWHHDQNLIKKIILKEKNDFLYDWQYCHWNNIYNMWNIDMRTTQGQISELKLDIYYYKKYKQNTLSGPLVYTESEDPYWKGKEAFISKSYYYDNLIMTDFENRRFPITKYYKQYLNYLYGENCIEEKKIKNQDYYDSEIPSSKRSDPITGHTEGVFDCLHYGHLRLLKRMRDTFDKVIVSCTKDEVVESYKSPCLDNYSKRVENLSRCPYVDKVIEPPKESLISIDYMNDNEIDYAVHGKTDEKFLKKWYQEPIKEKRMVLFDETLGIRSSDIKKSLKLQKK